MSYQLDGKNVNGSNTGISTLTLPYEQTEFGDAADLWEAIDDAQGGAGTPVSISRYIRSADALKTYTGTQASGNFTIKPSEGYLVQIDNLDTAIQFEASGDHETTSTIYLYKENASITMPESEGTSAAGITDYGPPYCGLSKRASTLMAEINAETPTGSVDSISRFNKTNDTYEAYSGLDPANDFDIRAGESYRIKVNDTVSFVPDLIEFDYDDLVQDIDDLLTVTAYPGIPGCTIRDGHIGVESSHTTMQFRVEVDAEFNNVTPLGQGTCVVCIDDKDECPDCATCSCCIDEEIVLAPGSSPTPRSCSLPDCSIDCDNQYCDGGSDDGDHCKVDSECADPGTCEEATSTTCPDCGVAMYHCTAVDTASVVVTVTGFRCDANQPWTENVCDGGVDDGRPCTVSADCTSPGTCDAISVTWAGDLDESDTPLDDARQCPAVACPP